MNLTDDQKNPQIKTSELANLASFGREEHGYISKPNANTHTYTWHVSVAGQSQLPGNKKGVMERGG